MSQNYVQGSVTLRKLRTGATVAISLSSSMQLFQLYQGEGSSAKFAPDWTGGTYPRVSVITSSTQSVSIVSVLWKINGQLVSTFPDYQTVLPSTLDTSTNTAYLDIKTNIGGASYLNFNSGTLTAEITFTDGSGFTQTVTKSETIRIQKAVEGGYTVFIDASPGMYVDESTSASNPTKLTATVRFGLNDVTSQFSAGRLKWFKSVDESPTASTPTGSTYNITNPDDVNGSQLYICRAYDADGNEVDAEGIQITDRSDTMYISASVQQYKGGSAAGIEKQNNATAVNVADEHDQSNVEFKVCKSDGTDYGAVPSWTVEKRHAGTMKIIKEVSGSTTTTGDVTSSTPTTAELAYGTATATSAATASIIVYDKDYINADAGSVRDEVIVTATANLTTSI